MPKGDHPTQTYEDLLSAWDSKTCETLGPLTLLRVHSQDGDIVHMQRNSRGSLLEWLLEGLSPICESCEQLMYEHAQSYQDELLNVIMQLDIDLGREAHLLHTLKLPDWCGNWDFRVCIAAQLDRKPGTFKEHVELFRRKATLVSLFNDHLDDLTSHEAKAYMTCRAVEAAKIDFDLTADDRNSDRGEAKRRAEQFFRIEASVGMD